MGLKFPPLATLKSFEAAARLESFKAAADELGRTPSAVSHGIETLESWLGEKVFERLGRKVVLTEAGQRFQPYVTEGLSLIAIGAERISRHAGQQSVRISAAPTFVRHWLLPRLHDFSAKHPDVSIEIDTAAAHRRFPVDGIDLCIRLSYGPLPGCQSDQLFEENLVPVAHRDLISRLGGGQSIDWENAPLIGVSTASTDWPSWFEARGLTPREKSPCLMVDQIHLAWAAAGAGLGIALARLPLAEEMLDQEDLIVLTDLKIVSTSGYWLLHPPGDDSSAAVRNLRLWLQGLSPKS